MLQLVAEGRTNKQIAALLKISEKTVDFHKSCIKRELALNSTAELVDPKHYSVEFENDKVRVLRIKYGPGERTTAIIRMVLV